MSNPMDVPLSVLIVLPTYNERRNLPTLVAQIRATLPSAHVLIVDDNSPDGTGAIADTLAGANSAIHVLHRSVKDGLGRAYVAGFAWGLAHGYDRLVQMDADLSHDPLAIPRLLEESLKYDVVLGSRYVRGGGTRHWNWPRRALSRCGSCYARAILALPYRDLTGGFKCWRRATLERIDLETIRSNGYSFQIEMTYRAAQRGFTISEEPIIFRDRTVGASKMNGAIVREAIAIVWYLRGRTLLADFTGRPAEAVPGVAVSLTPATVPLPAATSGCKTYGSATATANTT